jgi:hypothetical protein
MTTGRNEKVPSIGSESEMPMVVRKRIGVFPKKAWHEKENLFSTLEAAYPVRFEEPEVGEDDRLDGAIVFAENLKKSGNESRLEVPALVMQSESPGETASRGTVEFADTELLPRCLRGQRLESQSGRGGLPIQGDDVVTILASRAEDVLWLSNAGDGNARTVVAATIEELPRGDSLLDHINSGPLLPYFALLHFIRGICADQLWQEPGLRASILIDDPNLHSTSYGYLNFAEVVEHAEAHNYHVAVAMVPLDGWLAVRSAARMFRENDARLSILIHGNNHTKRELNRPSSESAILRLLAQALRRIDGFRSRFQLPVSRVMTAPHGVCSENAIKGMFRLNYDGICISRPYPWLPRSPSNRPLAGWFPAELVVGGFPVICRHSLNSPKDSILLRSFLHHPIVLCGHHTDVAEGLGIFREWADFINGLDQVRWMSLEDVGRTNYAHRLRGTVMEIRPYSRRISIRIPPGIKQLSFQIPPVHGELSPRSPLLQYSVDGREISADLAEPIDVTGGKEIEVAFVHPDAIEPNAVPAPIPTPWPILRKFLVESRDRLLPRLRKFRAKTTVSPG